MGEELTARTDEQRARPAEVGVERINGGQRRLPTEGIDMSDDRRVS